MNRFVVVPLGMAGLLLAATLFAGNEPTKIKKATGLHPPVVVELFTSEGCSSCPPADALLQKFDGQPFPGAQLIVLSEHVDYWNHSGWKDPFSAPLYSERQSAYGHRLRLDSVYTPQMIVDGTDEFVGSNSTEAESALDKATAATKVAVAISRVTRESNQLKAHVETGELPPGVGRADVILVIALQHAESQVAAGENSGHRLTHVAVVRSLAKVGSLEARQLFSRDVAAKLEPGTDSFALRVIAFIQEPGPGKILGAASVDSAK